jgi:hypothetical protein
MKRFAVLGVAAIVGVASTAHAQLTMNVSNGWAFTFSGNVNAFYVESWSNAKPGATINGSAVVQGDGANGNIRTGLLPAIASFGAKGKEGDWDIGVQFAFDPEIQNGTCSGCNGGNAHDQFGAQIDLREAYLTIGKADFGQILAGREIGLFLRQNILTDATLFGTGPTGGNRGAGGTTLGRIGFGYVYPNFNAQITYSTPAGKPAQWSIGVFQPSAVQASGTAVLGALGTTGFGYTPLPRVESELTYDLKLGQGKGDNAKLWVNGEWQEAKLLPTGSAADSLYNNTNPTVQTGGVGAGAKIDVSRISVVGSGYYGRGIGTTLMFDDLSVDANGQTRTSYGYIGQVTLKLDPQWSVVASYGESFVDGTSYDKNIDPSYGTLLKYNSAAVGGLVYQWTKSVKAVLEYTYQEAANTAGGKNISNNLSGGLMLFF